MKYLLAMYKFLKITTFLKENVLVLPELVYEDFLFKPKKFEFLPCQTKCNKVQQNAFSIRQNIEILPKNKRFTKVIQRKILQKF
jgi:hypothetical protein